MPKTTIDLSEKRTAWVAQHATDIEVSKTEVLCRAIDFYREAEEKKKDMRLLTPEHWRAIRAIARATGKKVKSIVQLALDREIRRQNR